MYDVVEQQFHFSCRVAQALVAYDAFFLVCLAFYLLPRDDLFRYRDRERDRLPVTELIAEASRRSRCCVIDNLLSAQHLPIMERNLNAVC